MWSELFVLMILDSCSAVIYHLNDTEYERMPPLFGLDAYESCLRYPGSVYCIARFDLEGKPEDNLFNLIKEYSKHTIKHYNHSYLERGICVTKSCRTFAEGRNIEKKEDLESVLEGCFNETIWRNFGLSAKLVTIYNCDKYGEIKEKDGSDWFVASIIVGLIAMTIIGTYYDIFFNSTVEGKNKRKGNPYLLCFSLGINWNTLTSTAVLPQMESLKSIYSIKCITTFLMVIAHVMWVNSTGFTDNSHDFEKAYESAHYQLIFNGMMIIQIYFVLSGFLLTYNLLIQSEKQLISWENYRRILFMRWWRLTPSNAVMLAFMSTWLRHLGSGPLWKMRVVDSVAADCRRYWWSHLLYINNYLPQDRFCAIQTWYISADIQLYALGTAVFLATKSWGKLLPLSLLMVAGMVIPALQVWLQDLDGLVMMTPEMYRANLSDTYYLMHVKGHTNLISFAIGMAAGYSVYHLQKKRISITNNKILYNLSWCITPAICCLFLSAKMLYADGERPNLAVRMAWASLHRVVMGGIAAFTILSVVMRSNDKISSFLEWRGWMVPGRLSYGVYLLHINFIHVLLGSSTQLARVSFYNMIIIHLGVVFISLIAALPFYLIVEAPLSRLMKTIVSRSDSSDLKTK